MAVAAVFGLCPVVLSTIASPAVRSEYEKLKGDKKAVSDLDKVKESVEMIQAVILDAEKRQNEQAVKLWIKMVQDVLYEADDLFDEVAADYELGKLNADPTKKRKFSEAFNLKINGPATPSESFGIEGEKSIAKRVEDIMKRLDKISEDMVPFNFMKCPQERENYGMQRETDPGFVFEGSEKVIGRVKEKKAILQMVLQESNVSEKVSIVAIVGIGGMGKTTLAHLIYEDEKVQEEFKDKRWFVSISNTSNDEEVVRKIYLSVCKGSERRLPSKEDQRERIKATLSVKFLLVLDDVWDDDRNRWEWWDRRMGLWSSGREGSRVIVTTRSDSVVLAIEAWKTHQLDGLSEKESWDLFESIVQFTPEQESDPEWASLGREIVKKCANSPLAIRSIASLLHEKNTIEEWRSIKNGELIRIGHDREDGIKKVLLLSYHHLSSTLKRCFAYLSLFPKGAILNRDDLIRLWISQGYVNDAEGLSCFLDLKRRSFLQTEYKGVLQGSPILLVKSGGWVRMHDLIHDLAQEVASEECIILPATSSSASSGGFKNQRHLRVEYCTDNLWVDTRPQFIYNRLRSFLCQTRLVICSRTLKRLCLKFECLRALTLCQLGIGDEDVPGSIGELKHLRYLDLSRNPFERLPDSISNLVNLYFLDISECLYLEVLPSEFRRLVNIRALLNDGCWLLKSMPPGFNELSNLQELKEFPVSSGTERSKLDVLPGLKLRGHLEIVFHDETDDWVGIQCWHPPPTLESLSIREYKGPRIPRWGNDPELMITSLTLSGCTGVKCLPPLRHLPKLKKLFLFGLSNLEYVEGEGEEEEDIQSPNAILPALEYLKLTRLDKLVCWSRKLQKRHGIYFPSLLELHIESCPNLTYLPSCPNLETLQFEGVKANVSFFPSYTFPLPSLQELTISRCDDMVILAGKSFTSLRTLSLKFCRELKKVDLPPSQYNKLERLVLGDCPSLKLWDENTRGIDWDSLSKLTYLDLSGMKFFNTSSAMLPDCLQRRVKSGSLEYKYNKLEKKRGVDSDFLSKIAKLDLGKTSGIHPSSSASTPSKLGMLSKSRIAFPKLGMLPDWLQPHRSWDKETLSLTGEFCQDGEFYHFCQDKETLMEEFLQHEEFFHFWQDKETLIEASVMEDSNDPRFIFFVIPEDYEIEEDTLIWLWMAAGRIKDEQEGEDLFRFFSNIGYLSRCGTNSTTGRYMYHINAEKINQLLQSVIGHPSYYLQWKKEDQHNPDVQSIRHLSLGNSTEIDSKTFETIAKKFTKLKSVLFFGNRGHKAIQMPRDLFSSFNKLEALDLSRTYVKELPSSIRHMSELRYLDLSWTLIELLPDILCSLVQLQTLRLRGCYNLNALPEKLHQLTNLRHLDVDVLGQLDVMPTKMGELKALRTLSAFLVGTEDGRKIQELNELNELSRELCIANLENVRCYKEAEYANLPNKKQLKKLELRWTSSEICGTHNNSDAILDKLQPFKDLEELQISCYEGEVLPDWIGKPEYWNLVSILFYRCENLRKAPAVDKLPNLKHLQFVKMNSVTEFTLDEEDAYGHVALFPKLEKLEINEMKSLEIWDWKNSEEGDFSSLTHLIIEDCPNLVKFDVFPHLPLIRFFEIRNCPKLETLSDSKLPDSLGRCA